MTKQDRERMCNIKKYKEISLKRPLTLDEVLPLGYNVCLTLKNHLGKALQGAITSSETIKENYKVMSIAYEAWAMYYTNDYEVPFDTCVIRAQGL